MGSNKTSESQQVPISHKEFMSSVEDVFDWDERFSSGDNLMYWYHTPDVTFVCEIIGEVKSYFKRTGVLNK